MVTFIKGFLDELRNKGIWGVAPDNLIPPICGEGIFTNRGLWPPPPTTQRVVLVCGSINREVKLSQKSGEQRPRRLPRILPNLMGGLFRRRTEHHSLAVFVHD